MHKSEAFTCSADLSNVRSICTSDHCPMSQLLHAMPSLCEPPPPLCHAKRQVVDPKVQAELADFAEVKAFPDTVWGPAKWTALESEILSLPEEIDQSEFCMFKTYLALNARYLPCGNCSRHFAEHIAAMPNDRQIRTRAGLLKWLTMVHNDVNRRKHREPLTHQQIVDVLSEKSQKKTTTEEGQQQAGPGQEAGLQSSGFAGLGSDPLPLVILPLVLLVALAGFVFFIRRKALSKVKGK
jgi:hypothetical protein